MASLNRVFLIGNLTRDPELRYIPSGQAVTTLGLAVNNRFGSGDDKKEDTLFIDVNVWGKAAESSAEYLKKGSPVFIEGRLRQRQWDDKETGQKRSKIEVTANTVQFLPSGSRGGAKPAPGGGDEPDMAPPPDDDVPF
ncbi:MAG: single-stranded DNA-binding protein [Nitrospinae bacterium]|nr:single-stranded DNA-binding protein [Nitrospinota bacterium]